MNMIITKTQPEKYEELYSDKYFVVYKIIDDRQKFKGNNYEKIYCK